jgi:hypothetical protein
MTNWEHWSIPKTKDPVIYGKEPPPKPIMIEENNSMTSE